MVSIFGRHKDKDPEEAATAHDSYHPNGDAAEGRQKTRRREFELGGEPDMKEVNPDGSRPRRTGYGYGSGTRRRYHDTGSADPSEAQGPPHDAEEARCTDCGEHIYIDPKTDKPYDPQPPRRPEICGHCGRPWPVGKPYSERILKAIKERLDKSRHQNAQCKSCSKPRYVDHGTQVDERDIERGYKRALLIVITYRDQEGELNRTHKDNVKHLQKYLIGNGYRDEDVDILMEQWDSFRHPTRNEIISHMKKLVDGAKKGDYLFFHYSGRGTEDGVYPVDHNISVPKGVLKNTDMHDILVNIPIGVHLTALFDSCHSSSILNLPYVPHDGKAKHQKQKDQHGGNVILWSGWKDTQTGVKPKIRRQDIGAMSEAFIKADEELLKEKGFEQRSEVVEINYTYGELLDKIKSLLQKKSQIPQLSSTHHLDLERVVSV